MASLRGLDMDDCGLVVRALVGDETQWLFTSRADESKWSAAGTSLLQRGFGIIDGFLGAKLSLALREQARQKFEEEAEDFEHINDQFAAHGLCSTRLTELNVDDLSVTFMPHLSRLADTLVQSLAEAGVEELRSVTQRSQPMLAVYPAGGRYMRHVDNPGGNGRLLTIVYYLNACWREQQHGGSLRLWSADYSAPLASIPPLLDRAVLFWSDKRVPHEVMPAQRARYATQIWFHNDEAAAPQDDSEYRATLSTLSSALRRKAHVQVKTIDQTLSAALEALRAQPPSGTCLRWVEEAAVSDACLAWLCRLEAAAPESRPTLLQPLILRVEGDETHWLPMLAGAQALVLVQLGVTREGGGVSAHCECESARGWPGSEDAPVDLETTPGQGAVFLHVLACGAGQPAVHLRLTNVHLLAVYMLAEGDGGGSIADLASRQAALALSGPVAQPSNATPAAEGVEDFSNEGLADEDAAELLRQMCYDEEPAGSLVLTSNRLTTLPEEVGELTSLHTLRLGGNHMSQLPEAISRLHNLLHLGANCNRLSSLPDGVGQLSALQSLRLHGNSLTLLPDSIGNLRSLQSLALGGNLLERLPDAIGGLRSLRMLALNCNRLSALPESVGRLCMLQVLAVDGNRLASLPSTLGNLSALTTLNASGNLLTELPASISSLGALITLNLSANRLAVLPAGLQRLTALQTVNLTSNQLTALPQDDLRSLTSLHTVLLPANRFSGGRLSIALTCKSLWLDIGVACGPELRCSRLIAGTSTPELPYLNFLQQSRHTAARALVVAFGISGFDFGGVIARARADVDVLFVFDQQHSSYLRDDEALRAFLLQTRTRYARVGAIGSSQSAFGALHYSDCVDAVLAISPLDSFVQQQRHLSVGSAWLPDHGKQQQRHHQPSGACRVTIHVAADNFLDRQYVEFCEATHFTRPGQWALSVVKHEGARHPAYPGDAAVAAWVRALRMRRVEVVEEG